MSREPHEQVRVSFNELLAAIIRVSVFTFKKTNFTFFSTNLFILFQRGINKET
jgi:hypothetical protein